MLKSISLSYTPRVISHFLSTYYTCAKTTLSLQMTYFFLHKRRVSVFKPAIFFIIITKHSTLIINIRVKSTIITKYKFNWSNYQKFIFCKFFNLCINNMFFTIRRRNTILPCLNWPKVLLCTIKNKNLKVLIILIKNIKKSHNYASTSQQSQKRTEGLRGLNQFNVKAIKCSPNLYRDLEWSCGIRFFKDVWHD